MCIRDSIYINPTEERISLEDSILAAFLSLVGFDVLFFVPTGYQCIEQHFTRPFASETQIGDYLYDLDVYKRQLTHGALALCLAFRYPQMWVLFGLMVLKEGYMVVMGLLFFRKGKMLNLKIS